MKVIKSVFENSSDFITESIEKGYVHRKLNFTNIIDTLSFSSAFSFDFRQFINENAIDFGDVEDGASDFWNEMTKNSPFNKAKSAFSKELKSKKFSIEDIDPHTISEGRYDVVDYLTEQEKRITIKGILNTQDGTIGLGGREDKLFKIGYVGSFGAMRYKIMIPYNDGSTYAMILYFRDFSGFMYVLKRMNKEYSQEAQNFLIDVFKRKFKSAGSDINILDELYYWAPEFVLIERGEKAVWKDLELLMTGNVNEYGTDEERAVLNILSALSSPNMEYGRQAKQAGKAISGLIGTGSTSTYQAFSPEADQFLENLLSRKVNGVTLFSKLYDKIDNWGGADNFTELMRILYIAWIQSSHVLSGPYPLYYKSEELLGFYNTSHDFVLSKDARQISGFRINSAFFGNPVPSYVGTVGVYDRVYLINNSKIETPENINIPTYVPAFFLKGIDDDTAAHNLEKAIVIALDVLTTFTGIGNFAKFKHLYRMLQGASTLSKSLVVMKIGISAIEVTSGMLGILLNVFEKHCNGKFCDSLRTVLFWMDLASLGADVITSRMLKNSAKGALNNLDSIPSGMPKADYDELVESLKKLAGVKKVPNLEELERDLLKKLNLLNKSKIMDYGNFLDLAAKIKKTFGVDMKVIRRASDEYAELFKRWQDNPIYAVFHHKKFINGRYQIALDGPAIYFFSGFSPKLRGTMDLTTYTIQHELFHLKLWYKLEKLSGKKIPRRIHEEYVLSEFLKSAEKWDLNDLMNDLSVLNENYRYPQGLPYVDLDYFKNWDLETELKKVKF